MKVAIVETLEGGTTQRIATFSLQNGRAVCDNPTLWKHLLSSGEGSIVGLRGRRYHPEDGMAFLQNLKYQYAGPYLRAQAVEEDTPRLAKRPTAKIDRAIPPAPTKKVASAAPAPAQRLTSNKARSAAPAKAEAPPPKYPTKALNAKAQANNAVEGAAPPKKKANARAQAQSDAITMSSRQLLALHQQTALLTHAIRSLEIGDSQKYCNALKQLFIQLGGEDAQKGVQYRMAQDDFVALKCLSPSGNSYAKLWEKLLRTWDLYQEALGKGELAYMLHHLTYIDGILTELGPHRQLWSNSLDIPVPSTLPKASGTSQEERDNKWLKSTDKAFKKYGPGATALAALFKRGERHARDAVTELGQGNYGRAESALKTALHLDPALSEARLLLAELLQRMDRTQEAQGELFHLLEADSVAMRRANKGIEKALIYARIARTHHKLAQQSLLEGKVHISIAHLEKAVGQMDWIHRQALAQSLGEYDRQQLQQESKRYTALLTRLYGEMQLNPRASRVVSGLPKSWVTMAPEAR